ncbi:DNA-directed RNA polymerase III subunit RPC5 [Saguinus oedipus]|uniref:DNA-directed RNA polymerase III subunit RPC5 n=1 Tax=Saguinus oedipus TaxID=9490 RepID=A0ABQ9THF6_SAGOE|nr:DNA-directed RNA polymerase III subunit RPC5 [Saguinus oedipus]
MTYDDIPHLSAKIKSKQQKQRGADCAERGRGLRGETSTYCSKLMDKQAFCSSQTTSNTSRYAAALYRQGELHLTPSHGILQLRPSFSYLDKVDAKHREKEAGDEAG